MRILVVSQYYYPEPFRISDICEALVKRGHSVTVITGIPNYPEGEFYPGYENISKTESINGVNVIRCKIRPRKTGNKNLALNYLSFVFYANRVLKKLDEEFDVVYGYQLSPVTSMLPAKKYSKNNGIPFYLYCLDVWPESIESLFHKGSLPYNVIKKTSRNIYKAANRIGVTSPCFKEYLSKLVGNNDNIAFLPQHAIEILDGSQGDTSTNLTKKEVVSFVFVGNIGSSQNLEGVIRALSNVQDKTKIKLHIIGSGSSLESVKEKSRKLGLNETVVFYGRQPKSSLTQYYKTADVCIVSLRKEGLVGNTIPGKLQEYMSAGKAILAFIDGDAAWVVEKANCGVTVPSEDEKTLTEAFSLFFDKKRTAAWGKNARTFYEENFTIEKHIDELEKEFLRLCKGND